LTIGDGLLGVIDELYAGVLDRDRLSASVGRTAALLGASGGLLYAVGHGEDTIRFGAFSDIDLEALNGMGAQTLGMMTQFIQRIPLGHVDACAATWPIEDMKKSAVYNEIFRKLDILHGAAGLAVRNGDYVGGVTLNRPERAGPFSDEQFRALEVLVPHFRNVLQINNAMRALEQARATFVAALDSLPDGVVLTDRNAKVVHLNRAAERMLACNDGISVKGGHLAAGELDEERALHRLIGEAAVNRGTDSFARGGTCTVRRPSGAPAWLVLATPCSDAHALAAAPLLPACTVLVRDRSRADGNGLDGLRQACGLTAQEARVALTVAEGHGLTAAAQKLGLSVLTVRNHLQRVFAKTGTSRQAELARLVTAFMN
jgi:DNA-binding CsgD family transcriptional regulator